MEREVKTFNQTDVPVGVTYTECFDKEQIKPSYLVELKVKESTPEHSRGLVIRGAVTHVSDFSFKVCGVRYRGTNEPDNIPVDTYHNPIQLHDILEGRIELKIIGK